MAAAVATCGVVALVGCTGGSTSQPSAAASPDPSRALTTSAPVSPTAASTPGCPAPTLVTTPPTDFPHPALTRYPVDPTTQAADDRLAAQGLAATRTFGGPIAAGAFQHYLDATGSYLALPVDDLLTATPALVAALDTALVAAAAPAVQQVLGSAATSCTVVPFASGWDTYADLTAGDWYATLGGFRHRVLGAATRTGGPDARVCVTYRAAIGDTYDFDPGSTFEAFGRLALHGRAADFLDGGLTTTRVADVRTAASELATPGFG